MENIGFMNNIELEYSKLPELDDNPSIYLQAKRLYFKLFNELASYYEVGHYKSGEICYIKDYWTDARFPKKNENKIYGINGFKFLKNLLEKESVTVIPVIYNSYSGGTLYVGDHFIIVFCASAVDNEESPSLDTLNILSHDDSYIQNLYKYIPEFYLNTEPVYNYVSIDNQGNFGYSEFKLVLNKNVSLDNYNDDVPYKEYLNFCNKKGCGLALMYGEPGTGKTTLIKKLISNSETTFFILDASILANITSSAFMDFLVSDCENSVFILEDCEKLLMDRNISNNPWIGTLLNLTDGMLGEGLSIKFICTFNAPLKSIDPALLRKGRLKVNYEFRPLSSDKVEKLGKQLNKDLHGSKTLAEIYTEDYTDNTSLTKSKKSVGFR